MNGLPIPKGYVGPVTLPTGREVFWTGKIAIGIEHRPAPRPVSESATWIQELLTQPQSLAREKS